MCEEIFHGDYEYEPETQRERNRAKAIKGLVRTSPVSTPVLDGSISSET